MFIVLWETVLDLEIYHFEGVDVEMLELFEQANGNLIGVGENTQKVEKSIAALEVRLSDETPVYVYSERNEKNEPLIKLDVGASMKCTVIHTGRNDG